MAVKFNRLMIASINNSKLINTVKNKSLKTGKKVAVPEKETFQYIFNSAIKGNEMAAVLIDEWQRSCKPSDEKEEQIISSINSAAKIIFK